MVKSVVADETQLKSLEDRLFHSSSAAAPLSLQVGLVIGKLSATSDRGLVYALIPTPPTEAGESACYLRSEAASAGATGRDDKKKGASKKAPNEAPQSVVVDADWVAEHARQVSRMLLGGMNVVGIYIWASEASFKATAAAIFCQVIRGVAQAAPWYDTQFDERLLIHISYAPRRLACRICNWASGNLHPCDLKLSKIVASLQEFRCKYNFEVRLPIDQASSSDHNSLKNAVTKAINHLSKKIQPAEALLNGYMVQENLSLSKVGPHNVELLIPFDPDSADEDDSNLEDVAGLVLLTGSVCAFAYLGPREPVAQAISDLKGDIITSLKSRFDLMLDEAEGEDGLAGEDVQSEKSIRQLKIHELEDDCRLSFHRRVMVPWFSGIYVCDYLQQSETFEDTKDRCKEIMSMEGTFSTSSILETEFQSVPRTIKPIWEFVHGADSPIPDSLKNRDGSSSQKQTNKGSSKGSNQYFILAIFVLILAVLGGLGLSFFSSQK